MAPFTLLRRATLTDAPFCWDLSNDPDVRWASGDRAEIGWEEHLAWFTKLLADPHRRLWIAERDEPVGQIRADYLEGRVWVSLSVTAEARGLGLGRAMIRRVTMQRPWKWPCWARIRRENRASLTAFAACGYRLTEGTGDWAHMVHL